MREIIRLFVSHSLPSRTVLLTNLDSSFAFVTSTLRDRVIHTANRFTFPVELQDHCSKMWLERNKIRAAWQTLCHLQSFEN